MLCMVFMWHMVANGDWPQGDLQFSWVSGMSGFEIIRDFGRMQD